MIDKGHLSYTDFEAGDIIVWSGHHIGHIISTNSGLALLNSLGSYSKTCSVNSDSRHGPVISNITQNFISSVFGNYHILRLKDDNTNLTVTDIDGNIYHTITIGTQTWFVENLKVTHYRNGNAINNVTGNTQWAGLATGAWCYYNNSNSNNSIHGKLYNWYSITDTRNIAPNGWHVPTDDDWTILRNYLDDNVAGGKLKSTTLWSSPNSGANNSTEFTAYASGIRDENGIFKELGNTTRFWSTTDYLPIAAWNCGLFYNYTIASRDGNYKQCGFSIRCVKD